MWWVCICLNLYLCILIIIRIIIIFIYYIICVCSAVGNCSTFREFSTTSSLRHWILDSFMHHYTSQFNLYWFSRNVPENDICVWKWYAWHGHRFISWILHCCILKETQTCPWNIAPEPPFYDILNHIQVFFWCTFKVGPYRGYNSYSPSETHVFSAIYRDPMSFYLERSARGQPYWGYVRGVLLEISQGIVGCTPCPTYPRHGKSLGKPYSCYLWVSYPQELHKKHHGSTRTLGAPPLPETNSKFAPENRPKLLQKGNDPIPTIHFQCVPKNIG